MLFKQVQFHLVLYRNYTLHLEYLETCQTDFFQKDPYDVCQLPIWRLKQHSSLQFFRILVLEASTRFRSLTGLETNPCGFDGLLVWDAIFPAFRASLVYEAMSHFYFLV